MIKYDSSRLKISSFFILLTSIITLIFSFSAYSHWTRINIGGGGAFNSVSVGKAGTIIANSDLGGSYISRDYGGSWVPIGALNSQMTMTHVQTAAFSPDSDDIILLSGQSDIARSTDNGKTFSPVTFTGTPVPSSGAVARSLAFAPSNASRVYASIRSAYNNEDSQIYRSDDAGQSFSQVSSLSLLSAPSILKLVVHPNNPDIVLALSQNGRFTSGATEALLLSTNGGSTWTNIATQFFNQSSLEIVDIAFHPNTTTSAQNPVFISVYDSGGSKVYFTSDITTSSPTWDQIHSTGNGKLALWPVNNTEFGLRMIDVVVSWHNGSSTTAWYVENGGTSWTTPLSIATARDWTGDDASSWTGGWNKMHPIFNPPLAGEIPKALGFDLTYTNTKNVFWATGQFVFKGHTLSDKESALEFSPACTSENPQNDDYWHSRGVDNITATLVDVNDTNPDVIYAGMQDIGCIVSTDQGKYWRLCNYFHYNGQDWAGTPSIEGVSSEADSENTEIANASGAADRFLNLNEGKAYGGNVYTILSDPDDASNVWMSASPDQRGDQTLLYSNDYGQSWTPSSTTITATPDVYGLSITTSPSTLSKVLYVTIDGEAYKSTNPKDTNGALWVSLPNTLCNGSNCPVRVTAADDSGNVYAGGESGLFYSDNEGQDWTAFTGLPSFSTQSSFHSSSWQGVSDIEVDPQLSGVVLISVFKSASSNSDEGGVYECAIQTQTCTQILGDPQDNQSAPYVRNLAIDPNDSNTIYVTSSASYTGPGYYDNSLGVYQTKDRGLTWENISTGLAWPSAFPISISAGDTEQVFIGSIGSGLYKKIIDSGTVADYREDFSAVAAEIVSGWSYKTNGSGTIGSSSSYVDLDSNNSDYYTSESSDYGKLSKNGGHTGSGTNVSSVDSYVMGAYTVSQTGTYFLKDGFVEFPKGDCSPYSNGGDVRVYVNDILKEATLVTNEASHVLDMELGQLSSGDTIYVAVGPNGTDGCDRFKMDYSIDYKNYPPVITNPGVQSSFVSTSDSLQITVSDPENDSLTYSAINLPVGMSINTSTGEITGTPTTIGTVYPTVTVSDASHSRSTSFTWVVSEASSSGISNYHDDFASSNPNGQWRYLWNENGPIGDNNNYSPMEWQSYRYTKYKADNSGPVDSMTYASLTSTSGHPGRGENDPGQSSDHFVIVAYDITQTGFYEIVDSEFDANLSSWEVNNQNQGQDIRIYVNNTLKQSIQRVDVNNFDFDMSLGMLTAGDTVYVAFGPKGSDGSDYFEFDFSIQETSLTTIASFQLDFQTPTPKTQWKYQWNNGGDINNVTGWENLTYQSWAYFEQNTSTNSPTQSTPFRYGRLTGADGHTGGAAGQDYVDYSGTVSFDQYVIMTYETETAGNYQLINGEIEFPSSGSDGGDIRIYADGQFVTDMVVPNETSMIFNVDLGFLEAGKEISVAVGPGNSDGADTFVVDFDIAK